jgi:hypothetical protein
MKNNKLKLAANIEGKGDTEVTVNGDRLPLQLGGLQLHWDRGSGENVLVLHELLEPTDETPEGAEVVRCRRFAFGRLRIQCSKGEFVASPPPAVNHRAGDWGAIRQSLGSDALAAQDLDFDELPEGVSTPQDVLVFLEFCRRAAVNSFAAGPGSLPGAKGLEAVASILAACANYCGTTAYATYQALEMTTDEDGNLVAPNGVELGETGEPVEGVEHSELGDAPAVAGATT